MSRKYQGLIVLNTKSLDGTVDELINTITKDFEDEGAKLANINQMGRQQFAYPSNHLDAGTYVQFDFETAPASIAKIHERLGLNNHVHLQHYKRIA